MTKLVIGDANVEIKGNMFMPTIGKHGKYKSTIENGQFVKDFAKERLIVKSIYFDKKNIYEGTWRAPDGT